MYSDEEDTEEYTEHFEEDSSSSTADVEEHVELDTDYGSASITDMTDTEELYIDNGSSSMDDMVERHLEDNFDELNINNGSSSMDDMVEHHLEDDIDELYIDNGSPLMDDMVEQSHVYDIDTLHMEMEDLHEGTIIWIVKSVPIMSAIDTFLRAPQATTMRVLMHKIVDFKYTILSIKSVPIMSVIDTILQAPQGAASNMPSHMSHHLGMARTVINIRHHMSFAATSHFMISTDQHLPRVFDDTTQAMVMMHEDENLDMKTTSTSCATTTMASTSSRAYGLRCYKCKQQGHPPRECPNLLCEVCKAKGHVAWQCTTPSAKTLYFDKLQAQVPKMPIAPTLQDEDRQGELKGDIEPSLALINTMTPPLEDDLGGDGVEHGDHGILPSPMEAHGVEMVEHGNFPSTKEAHGDEKVEPTPLCFIDELVPIPCEHESHLAHLSESDSELSDFHPICEFECFRLEDMSDTPSELREEDDRSMEDIAFANTLPSPSFVSSYVALGSTEDEFPLMETVYMVHEDDDISPRLLQDEHVDHMDPPTSTTPTSNESAYKGTRMTTSTATEHELTKRAIESYPNTDEIHDPTHGIHAKGYKAHQDHGEKDKPRSREGEKQLNMEMIMKPKLTSLEALQGRDGRWRSRPGRSGQALVPAQDTVGTKGA
ncbi:hypothetical protein QYE76_059827 [Lolium multiflorum]|uniref:CCHC-type domain-containing protein n=1 Tax=Lolium multiflorum TaxID=4521 RepID=A0AAD8RXX4_LOLMU|nr:hypothetical protein QYE76_059827 [Lolium multiflorum]